MQDTFLLPVTLGERANRSRPESLCPYTKPEEWEEFCDEYDRLALDPVLRYGPWFMRFSLVVALGGLIAAAVLGLSAGDNDDADDGTIEDDDDKFLATGAIVAFAIVIAPPFVLAAVLNCRSASISSKIVRLYRSSCQKWAAANNVRATVEPFNTSGDEGNEKVMIRFFDDVESAAGAPLRDYEVMASQVVKKKKKNNSIDTQGSASSTS